MTGSGVHSSLMASNAASLQLSSSSSAIVQKPLRLNELVVATPEKKIERRRSMSEKLFVRPFLLLIADEGGP